MVVVHAVSVGGVSCVRGDARVVDASYAVSVVSAWCIGRIGRVVGGRRVECGCCACGKRWWCLVCSG